MNLPFITEPHGFTLLRAFALAALAIACLGYLWVVQKLVNRSTDRANAKHNPRWPYPYRSNHYYRKNVTKGYRP